MPYSFSGAIGLAFSILSCIYLFSSSLCKYAILGALGALGSGRGALDGAGAGVNADGCCWNPRASGRIELRFPSGVDAPLDGRLRAD